MLRDGKVAFRGKPTAAGLRKSTLIIHTQAIRKVFLLTSFYQLLSFKTLRPSPFAFRESEDGKPATFQAHVNSSQI